MHRLAYAALLIAPALATAQELDIPYQEFELENGLHLIVHEDHSDPVVAVFVYYHVGSGREEPGRSGFAHLFEHMMFQGSEHVGDDQHFKLIQEAGGTLNGTTNGDRTNYFEVLPANQLELALWLESDRLGFLLPAMTQEKLDNQREVVKNERRQSYENRPYGLVDETIARNLYPAGHPYSWTTIGSMEDLSAASLEDVQAFFRRWYGPNNATLAVGGDVEPERVRALVEQWFGSIPRGPEVAEPEPRPAELERTQRVVLEDEVKLPQLSWTWPTVPMGHADEAALDLLASVLSANKSAVLDKALTVDRQLASSVSVRHDASELAGEMTVTLRPQPEVSLDVLEQELWKLLTGLAANGVEPERLERLKTLYEAGLVRGLETVSARTSRLASDRALQGDAGHVREELARHLAVSRDDVRRVLEHYVIGRPAVVVSVVPAGRLDLAASGRTSEQVAVEAQLDRRARPTAGEPPSFEAPAIWRSTLANGVAVVGTAFDELPLARFSLAVPAGRLHETMDRLGLASATAAMLEEGTKQLSGTELQDAFDALGATLNVSSDDDEISFTVSVLDKHLREAVALLAEIVLEPRFAPEDFARIQKERLTALSVRVDNPRAIAGDVWAALMYGADTVAGSPDLGTEETVRALSVAEVRDFWQRHSRPRGARLSYVGSLDAAALAEVFAPLSARWKDTGAPAEEIAVASPEPRFPERTTIYLVDKPKAEQSELRIGHPGVSSLDPLYYDLYLLNYPLGGSFSSRINLNLREDKGYTYGARSAFEGGLHRRPFTASAGVRTDVTGPSVTEFMKELGAIQNGVTQAELDFLRDSLTQAMTRQFESTGALLGFLEDVGKYGWPADYPERRLARVRSITKDELDRLAREHIHPERMAILVVGDQLEVRQQVADLPWEVVELDPRGRPISN